MTKNFEIETVKLIGSRLLAEANDLKRTIESISEEIDIDLSELKRVVNGEASYKEAVSLATCFSENYPINLGDLIIDLPDHINGVLIMRAQESKNSSRVFDRKDKNQELSEYYEYRDTATSNISPFKPEWIKELRFVENSDAENPDVAYNNGHFLHQMTAFIGPVNFYWEVNGKKYCQEMNTGDSNYITPFWKHSFTTRSNDHEAIIIAVTFAGNAARARKEIYHLNKNSLSKYFLDNRNSNLAKSSLLLQILNDRCINKEKFNELCDHNDLNLGYRDIENGIELNDMNLNKISKFLNISPSIFSLPQHTPENEVVIKKKNNKEAYILNSDELNPDYKVFTLAHNERMPQMFGFEFEVIGDERNLNTELNSSLHSYIYNFGNSPILFSWKLNEEEKITDCSETIFPGDSIYVEPFINHSFSRTSSENGNLFIFRVSGAISLEVQKEISSFATTDRLIESDQWFS